MILSAKLDHQSVTSKTNPDFSTSLCGDLQNFRNPKSIKIYGNIPYLRKHHETSPGIFQFNPDSSPNVCPRNPPPRPDRCDPWRIVGAPPRPLVTKNIGIQQNGTAFHQQTDQTVTNCNLVISWNSGNSGKLSQKVRRNLDGNSMEFCCEFNQVWSIATLSPK
jgi:hypothetical protein